jgi:chromosome partitioning protein
MIITVANQKGGVGKTDLSVNLSSCLAQMGRKTLLIDLDPQANATDYLLEGKPGLTTSDLLMKDDVSIKDVAVPTPVKGLMLAPGCPRLNAAQVELMNDAGMQFRLRRKLKGLKGYDYVFIDTPPSLGLLTVNALTASDSVLVPVQVHYFATEGVEKLLGSVQMIRKEINPSLEVKGYVLTMHDKRNNLSLQIEKLVRDRYGDKVFGSVIPVNVDLAQAPKAHRPIHMHSSESRGAYAYRSLAREFVKS